MGKLWLGQLAKCVASSEREFKDAGGLEAIRFSHGGRGSRAAALCKGRPLE
jgi:hypothetical protein